MKDIYRSSIITFVLGVGLTFFADLTTALDKAEWSTTASAAVAGVVLVITRAILKWLGEKVSPSA